MKKIFLFLVFLNLTCFVQAQTIQQAYEFYKKDQFESSIAILNKLKDETESRSSVYYLMGLNYFKIGNYDLAEQYLLEVTRLNSLKDVSTAYYYLGLSQFNKKDYEKAVTSFELSIDTSKDPQHDQRVEKIIERIIQIQNQIERDSKIHTLGLTAGYTYDTNAININDQGSVLNGHVFNYSAFYSQKMNRSKNSYLEPALYLADTQTLNYKLKQTEEIQSADATLFLASVPYKSIYDDQSKVTSLNLGLYLLPSNEQTRELSITLMFIKHQQNHKWTNDLDFSWQAIFGRDQSQLDFINAEDSQTALKLDLSGTVRYYIPRKNSQSLDFELGYIVNNAEGDNASYNKAYTHLAYDRPGWFNTSMNYKLAYSMADYAKSELGRKDNLGQFQFNVLKDLSDRTTLASFLNLSRNESTIEEYTYGDVAVGFQYIFLSRF